VSAPNVYENAARNAKAAKLLARIDARLGQPEGRDGAVKVALAVGSLSDAQWALIAQDAGCNPPSRATRAVVLGQLLERATRDLEPVKLEHLAEQFELLARARSFAGDGRYSTVGGERIQVSR